jgi:hypothetical protein
VSERQSIWIVEQSSEDGYQVLWACESESVAKQMVDTAAAIYRTLISEPKGDGLDVDKRVQKERDSYLVSCMPLHRRGKPKDP